MATRHLRDFARAIVPAKSVDVLTRFDDDPTAFGVVGTADNITWRSNDTRVDEGVAAPLLPVASALARRYGANVVAFATVDSNARPRKDLLALIWEELGLPAVIPRDAAARERACVQALPTLSGRVRLHLAAMGSQSPEAGNRPWPHSRARPSRRRRAGSQPEEAADP